MGELTDEGIEVFWQVKTRIHEDMLQVYDANGDLDYEVRRSRAVYPAPMRSAGVVLIEDAFVDLCGDVKYEDAIWAFMYHAVHMISLGYGDTPEHVVSLFSDIGSAEFANGVSYRFVDGVRPFDELDGLCGFVNIDDNGTVLLSIDSLGEEYTTEIEIEKDLISFMVSSIPI